jgi:hypothetical protein
MLQNGPRNVSKRKQHQRYPKPGNRNASRLHFANIIKCSFPRKNRVQKDIKKRTSQNNINSQAAAKNGI